MKLFVSVIALWWLPVLGPYSFDCDGPCFPSDDGIVLAQTVEAAQQADPTKDAAIEQLQKKIAALEAQAAARAVPSPEAQLETLRKQLFAAHAQLRERVGNPCAKNESRIITVAVGTSAVSVGCISPPKK